MAVRSLRVLAAYLAGDSRQPGVAQRTPIRIDLAPEPGVTPSSKPPVRIFVGAEAAQFRAERAFVWSVKRVRDPARHYEIHLMRDFAGFERRLWLTGFTNYRFAIPELAGGEGRAIYNDADQIYLQDPALLFDTPMDEHGVLSINDHDTSVMLMDCARMADLWSWETAQSTRNRKLEEQMRAVTDLWGTLDGKWNARDEEYVPGESGLVHYTTIHTQPWRPFPQDYVYRANVASEIWLSIEHEADADGFQIFDANKPSPEFAQATSQPVQTSEDSLAAVQRLVAETDASSLHYCGYVNPARVNNLAATDIRTVTPESECARDLPEASVDMTAADGLEQLPDLDIGWMLDRLFARARRSVIVSIDLASNAHGRCPNNALWWYAQMAAAGARHPHRYWRLQVTEKRFPGRSVTRHWSGGALLNSPPSTWALLYFKTGHRSQALGVADALGWPYETREIWNKPLRYWLAALRVRLLGATGLPNNIEPPWPEVVIASGWLPCLVARWITRHNQGATRFILMGRRGGPVGESQNIAVACQHFDLPPHPQHIETVLPPSKVAVERLGQAAERWPILFGDGPRPRVTLLVGGDSAQHKLDAATATEMVAGVRKQVDAAGGSLAVLTSRRTRAQAQTALRDGAGHNGIFEPWKPDAGEANPYLGYLATSDILVVTGESESMLAEAVATGKPVYIYPLPEADPSPRQRLANWVVHQARTDRFNKRGSRRPQQGLQYLCARIVEQRLLLPCRNMQSLHRALVEQDVARMFGGALEIWQPPAWNEIEALAAQIRALWPTADQTPTIAASTHPRDRQAANG